ncbi:hypothetical protein ACFVAV_30870 [Nocardia sp. NPDC057663]|uniref:hypothetical protein n=1 Tax=Nocardia sp. NPDC057663 TaxID=3346201 RepID=UPI0036721C14
MSSSVIETDPNATEQNGTADPPPSHPTAAGGRHATVSLPLSTVLAVAVALIALIVTGVLTWLLLSARQDLSDRDRAAADRKHAEQVATNYALGASTIDYRDLRAWQAKLKAQTIPALASKFDATAPALQDILVPLQWTSTANPIAAVVASENGGAYEVDVFLNVSSTNAQTPNGGQTTVTYTVTVDRNDNWQISDVGGMDAALPVK